MKKILIFIFFLTVYTASAKICVSLFPLDNRTHDKLYSWIGYSLPEIFYRTGVENPRLQIWDPVFTNSVDSTCIYKIDSDSLVSRHQKRWKWDYAVGGFYTLDHDSILIVLTVLKKEKESNKITRQVKNVFWPVEEHLTNTQNLVTDLITGMGLGGQAAIPSGDALPALKNIHGYATYAMGYGYEMQGDVTNALSAYTRVLEIDPAFFPASYRLGLLYGKSRQVKLAQQFLDKAFSRAMSSSLIAAEIASLYLSGSDQGRARSFIESHRPLLERTPAGMRVIGLSYIYQGEYQRAVSVLSRAVAEGPSDLEVDFALGKAYLYLGQFSNAADIFSRLLEYRPNYIRYYSFLGEAYRESGRLMESCEVLERSRKVDSLHVPNLINLANTYFKLGWYEKAEQYLLKAQAVNPNLNEIYINLGVVYWHTKRWELARRMFTTAATAKIHAQTVWNNEANILFLSGNIKKAIKIYKKAEQSGEKSSTILYNLGLAYLSVGNKKEALYWFDEVLQLSPGRMDVLFLQAQLAADLKLEKNAELYYRKILDITPGNTEVMKRFIQLLVKQKRLTDAIQIVETFLATYPQDIDFRILRADLYLDMGWYEVALESFNKMMQDKDFKDNPAVFLGVGEAMYDLIRYKKARDYDNALYYLKMAVKLDPKNWEPYYYLGNIYLDYKNYPTLALENWKTAYQYASDPDEKKKIMDLITEVEK